MEAAARPCFANHKRPGVRRRDVDPLFRADPRSLTVDGTQQPGIGGTTLSVASIGNKWNVVRKKGTHTQLSAMWSLSKDGNALTDVFTSYGKDGLPSTAIRRRMLF